MTLLAKIKKYGRVQQTTANLSMYLVVLVALSVFAYTSGERLAYVAALVLFVVPAMSYVVTWLLLKGLHVTQEIPDTIVKETEGNILIKLRNPLPLGFSKLECALFGGSFAVDTSQKAVVVLGGKKQGQGQVPFTIAYRGRYEIGLQAVYATDFTGIFRIKRNYSNKAKILALPRIIDLDNIPLSLNLAPESSSRFDIKDEDYSTIADIRQYVPTDSIKRVHWKLTAKRNEWLVKTYQSNALNAVTIIFDTLRPNIVPEEAIVLEDQMLEHVVGFARYCLNKNMPVEFLDTAGRHGEAKTGATFANIYNVISHIDFDQAPPLSPTTVFTQVTNDATGSVNAIVFTTQLTPELFERAVNALERGNYMAVMYFATNKPQKQSEDIYKVMEERGLPCFRVE